MPSHPALVAVVGASGGLGASTLALAVGRRLAATGPPAVVVDLDLDRGGLEVSAGIEHLPGRRWDDLRAVRGRVPPDLLGPSFPGEGGCQVLSARGGASPEVPERAVLDVLDALAQGPARVVLDLPATSPLLGRVLRPGALVLVVLGLRARALADADALVDRLTDGSSWPGVGASGSSAASVRSGTSAGSGASAVSSASAASAGLDTAAASAGFDTSVASGTSVADSADLRLVTRGARPGPDVLDDVVAHLGVAHLHHLLDDVRVPRAAERGVFPGVIRDAVRRCADVVVEAVDDAAVAS